MVRQSIARNPRTTMTATLDAHTYWTAMAHEVSLAQTAATQQQQQDDDDEYSKHKFGLCYECGYGLDDRSDFVLHTMSEGDTIFLCVECWIHPCPWSSKEY
jgi:hypothetical protein